MILFGALALMYLGVHPLETILRGCDNREFTLLQRVLTEFRVVIFYISLLIVPHPSRLNLDRDFSLSHSLIDPVTTLLCLAAIAGLLVSAGCLARKQRLVSFCILWFLGNLVIESSVIGLEIIFDHRTYLPSMLACLPAVVWLYPRLRPKWLGIGVLVTVVMVFSFWTYARNSVFRDQITIWGDCVAKSPNKARPHNNLGIFLKKKSRIDEARALFQKALQLKPEYASAHINLGATLVRQKRLEEALDHFAQALRIRGSFPEAHYSMGNVLALLGRIDEAQDHYQKALEVNPAYADAHLKLADILDQKGKSQEAIAHYQEALRIKPGNTQARNNLGATLASQGKLEEAIDHFTRVLKTRPNDVEAHFNMGNVKANQRKYEEAARYFAKALQINPKDREARRNLGKVHQMMKINHTFHSDVSSIKSK
jgi:tetratricopeptide (TPR) repeat protein